MDQAPVLDNRSGPRSASALLLTALALSSLAGAHRRGVSSSSSAAGRAKDIDGVQIEQWKHHLQPIPTSKPTFSYSTAIHKFHSVNSLLHELHTTASHSAPSSRRPIPPTPRPIPTSKPTYNVKMAIKKFHSVQGLLHGLYNTAPTPPTPLTLMRTPPRTTGSVGPPTTVHPTAPPTAVPTTLIHDQYGCAVTSGER